MSETLKQGIDDFFIRKEQKFLCFKRTVYALRPSTINLINLITHTNSIFLSNVTIHNNLIPLPKRYLGITWGKRSDKAHISLKKSFFNHEELSMQDITVLLEILIHECTHIKQINKYKVLSFGLLPYLFAHTYYYIKARSHDLSPLESEPIRRQHDFIRFNRYLNQNYSPYILAKVLSDMTKSEIDKIKEIDDLYKAYPKRRR